MLVYKKEFKDIWLKAAVIGSLWGSIEIIIGSFFHNIRFPMAGTFLAFLGICLISAYGQIWKNNGLIWRAGLISAVMKSVSPSAILIGPMTGIFMEAVLFEIAIFIFGKNYFAYILGAVFALYSVVIHKVITLVIIYGFDLVRITENFYFFIAKQLQIENLSFLKAFLLLSSVYIILGLLAAVFGIYIGKKANRKDNSDKGKIFLNSEREIISPNINKGSIFLLFVHLFVIVLVLTVTNMFSFELAFAITFIYCTLTILKYKRPLRYFKKPGFWIQIGIFIFISAVFYDGFNEDTFFTKDGIIAGLKMGIRAILIVIGFSAISSELRTPFIKVMLYRRGFWQFYTALGLAFSVLPHLVKNSSRPKKFLRNPIKSLVENINNSHQILEEFKKIKKRSKVIIITGKRHGGKTTFINEIIDKLKAQKLKMAGFLALGKFEDDKRSEFKIRDIASGKSKLLCKNKGSSDQKKIGRFYFSDEGIDFGKDILKPKNLNNPDYIIIDEIGPFELRGKGWSFSIESLIKSGYNNMIWIVREKLVYDVLRRFAITDAIIYDISKNNTKEVTNKLLDLNNHLSSDKYD